MQQPDRFAADEEGPGRFVFEDRKFILLDRTVARDRASRFLRSELSRPERDRAVDMNLAQVAAHERALKTLLVVRRVGFPGFAGSEHDNIAMLGVPDFHVWEAGRKGAEDQKNNIVAHLVAVEPLGDNAAFVQPGSAKIVE